MWYKSVSGNADCLIHYPFQFHISLLPTIEPREKKKSKKKERKENKQNKTELLDSLKAKFLLGTWFHWASPEGEESWEGSSHLWQAWWLWCLVLLGQFWWNSLNLGLWVTPMRSSRMVRSCEWSFLLLASTLDAIFFFIVKFQAWFSRLSVSYTMAFINSFLLQTATGDATMKAGRSIP